MQMPKIKFRFERKQDSEIAWDFYTNPKQEGIDFWSKGALRHHNDLIGIKSAKNKKDFLFNYVSSLYTQYHNKFKCRKKEINALYKKKEQVFFHETKKVFKNHPWPKGKYIAYLSIFDFCPRFLDNKTFFVFMYDNDDNTLFTIVHEMLHFIFYDYCLTKHPQIFKSQNTENGPFWEIAELFNAFVQQTPGFVKLHGQTNGIGYPELTARLGAAKEAWNGDIDDWLIKFGADYIKGKCCG